MRRALEQDARAVFIPQHGILPLEQSHTFSRIGPGQQALAACLGVANLLGAVAVGQIARRAGDAAPAVLAAKVSVLVIVAAVVLSDRQTPASDVPAVAGVRSGIHLRAGPASTA